MTPSVIVISGTVAATVAYVFAGLLVVLRFSMNEGLRAPLGPHILVFIFWPLVVALWIVKGVIWTVREPWLQHMRNLWRELAR